MRNKFVLGLLLAFGLFVAACLTAMAAGCATMSGKTVAFDAATCALEEVQPAITGMSPVVFAALTAGDQQSSQAELTALKGAAIAHAADAVICLVQRFVAEAMVRREAKHPMAERGMLGDPDTVIVNGGAFLRTYGGSK
jgi:hypothetical protein